MTHRPDVWVIMLLTLVGTPAIAEADPVGRTESVVRYVQLDLFAGQRAFMSSEGYAEMRSLSEGIPDFYVGVLYDRYRSRPWRAVALNLVTGGFGSILMGDWLYGTVAQAAMAASVGLTIGAVVVGHPRSDVLYPLAQVTGSIAVVTGVAAPFLYTYRHNTRLAGALGR